MLFVNRSRQLQKHNCLVSQWRRKNPLFRCWRLKLNSNHHLVCCCCFKSFGPHALDHMDALLSWLFVFSWASFIKRGRAAAKSNIQQQQTLTLKSSKVFTSCLCDQGVSWGLVGCNGAAAQVQGLQLRVQRLLTSDSCGKVLLPPACRPCGGYFRLLLSPPV